jgi:hypothetical protein
MAIEVTAGGTIVTGEHVELYRLLALKSALKLEMKGMKRRGRSVYSILKSEGYRGNKASVLKELETYIEMRFPS